MQKKIMIFHLCPDMMAKMDEEENRGKMARIEFLQQFIRDTADVDVLMDAAYKVASVPEEADFFSEVPEIIGQLYTHNLHFNAVRRRLMNPAEPISILQKLLPDVCQLCENLKNYLTILEDLYDQYIGFDNEDEDEECDEESGEEIGEDALCEVTIQYADSIPKQTIDRIGAGIHGVLAAYLGNIEFKDTSEGEGCNGCCCHEN